MNILLLSGSFREHSYNNTLLQHSKHCLGAIQTSQFAIEQLPFYSQALDGEQRPAVVQDFAHAIDTADALLIATPEYNYSIPGVLKNALDWASRPAFQSPLSGKRVGIISASPAPSGGIQAQAHLKHVLAGTLSQVYPVPPCCFGQSHQLISDGQITDPASSERLHAYIEGFLAWLETGKC